MHQTKENILDTFIRTCMDGYTQGWHERNGGNLTYHLDKAELETLKGLLREDGRHFNLGREFPSLGGEYFITTGSGKYMRDAELFPEETLGIIRIDEDGKGYVPVWGLKGARPTSELPTHLLNHMHRAGTRAIYHAHPANITALTYTVPQGDSRALTRILWQSETECCVVFPEGVGLVPWMVPGGWDIAVATSRLIEKYPAVIWSYHGAFCAGKTLEEAFGLMHTIEKAAEIYIKAKSVGIVGTIQDDDLRRIAAEFHVTLNPEFL